MSARFSASAIIAVVNLRTLGVEIWRWNSVMSKAVVNIVLKSRIAALSVGTGSFLFIDTVNEMNYDN